MLVEPLKKLTKQETIPRTEAVKAAIQNERQRISRELHDRALQLLSGIKMRADLCRSELIDNRDAVVRELSNIETATDKVIVELRNLLTEMQGPDDLRAGSLERRLGEELEIFRKRGGFKLDFRCSVRAKNLPYEVEKELYFTLREGVLNAVRHARATELQLRFEQTSNTYQAILRDNGIGFDVASTAGSSHYGLRGMRERIEKLGGDLKIDTAPGQGTQLTISVPL